MTESFNNALSTTLAAPCGPTDTTITLTSIVGWVTTGQFRILIENEILLVTNAAANPWHVTRGVEGTAAAAHIATKAVTPVLTAGALNQLKADATAAAGPTLPTTTGNYIMQDASGVNTYVALTQDLVAPGFTPTITMASGGNGPFRLGATWTPRLNGSPEPNASGVTVYNVNDNQGGSPTSRVGSTGNFASPASTYSLSAPGTVSLFANVTQNGVNKNTNTESAAFEGSVWTGVGTAGATGFNGATGALVGATGTLVETLSGNGVVPFSPAPASQKVYYACDQFYGTRTFKDAAGFKFSMNAPSTPTITNVNGVARAFYLYESVQLITGISNPITPA